MQTDRLWEGESIIPTLHKWKLIWSHTERVASGHDREHGPVLWSSCSPAQRWAQALLFASCQMPLRIWRMQELKHTQRAVMGDTKQFMLVNIYWVPAMCWLLSKQKRKHGPYATTFIWSTLRVATQLFPARLERFAVPWLPVWQLNLPVLGGVAVAPHQQQQWWPGCLFAQQTPPGKWWSPYPHVTAPLLWTHQMSSTSLDICLQPQAKPGSNSPCSCAPCSKPLSLKEHKQPIHDVKQHWRAV